MHRHHLNLVETTQVPHTKQTTNLTKHKYLNNCHTKEPIHVFFLTEEQGVGGIHRSTETTD